MMTEAYSNLMLVVSGHLSPHSTKWPVQPAESSPAGVGAESNAISTTQRPYPPPSLSKAPAIRALIGLAVPRLAQSSTNSPQVRVFVPRAGRSLTMITEDVSMPDRTRSPTMDSVAGESPTEP